MAISRIKAPQNVPQAAELLYAWQQHMLENVWHFNQVAGTDARLNDGCPVYVQPDRDLITRGLYTSFGRITRMLGYSPVPQWYTERIPFGDGWPQGLQSLKTQVGHIIDIGARAVTLIEADALVAYSNVSSSVVNDTATITVTTDLPLDEIQVFFRVADGASGAANASYRICPLQLTRAGGVVTITGHKALFVDPADYWARPYSDVNQVVRNHALSTDASAFVTQVDVYRVYSDITSAVTLIADPYYYACGGNAADLTNQGIVWVEDAENGIIRVKLNCGVCPQYYPQYVDISYRAGLALAEDGTFDDELAQAIVRYANTIMPQKPCEICSQANASWDTDQDVYREDPDTPFGRKYGGRQAYFTTKSRMMYRGGKL